LKKWKEEKEVHKNKDNLNTHHGELSPEVLSKINMERWYQKVNIRAGNRQ